MPLSRESQAEPIAPHPTLPQYYGDDRERRRFVSRLFDGTARHYESANRWMSLGSGSWYRRQALIRAGLKPGMTVLDVAVGTGLVARAARKAMGSQGRVIGLDASIGMLGQARRSASLSLVQGFAESLPVRDGTVDLLTIGYALRHVADLVVTFREFQRVLKPDGVVLMLELTRPRSAVLYHGSRFYLYRLIPWFSRLFGGEETVTLWRYFWDTIESCVPPRAILDALSEAGLGNPRRHQELGLFSEYTAVKPA